LPDPPFFKACPSTGSGQASVVKVASGGAPLFSNTEIVEDLVEEVVDEGFAEDAALPQIPLAPFTRGNYGTTLELYEQ
jgi:hypothetical protein